MDVAVESACAVFILPGQDQSGDRHVVKDTSAGVLLAVIDGLGHGPEAAAVAERTVASLDGHGWDEPLIALMRRCHAALGGTRGVVMNLATFDTRQGTLTWVGIGNVEGRLLLKTSGNGYAQQQLLVRPGVIGQRLSRLHASTTRIARGDVLIFATDGVSPDFADGIDICAPVQKIADGIIARHCKRNDDALVLVARYRG